MKISIVVPVYNVEKYLERCLESCLSQDIPSSEYEIIAVNDGSPDNCGAILERYSAEYDNIKVVFKENGGLSSARNAGWNVAKGEYIWFVDSDDCIKSNCLKKMLSVLDESNLEAVTFDYRYLDENSNLLQANVRDLFSGMIYTGKSLFKKGWIYPFSAVQFYIFRKSFLDSLNIKFKEGILFEDWLFTVAVYTHLSRCLYVDDKIYDYYLHLNSISNSKVSLKKGRDFIFIAKNFFEKAQSNYQTIYFEASARLLKSVYELWKALDSMSARTYRKEVLKEKFWIRSIMASKCYKYLVPLFLIKFGLKIL